MKGTYRSAIPRAVACVFALGLVVVLSMPAASAASKPVVKTVSIDPRRIYTDTGLTVEKGQTVTVRATGFIHFGVPPIDHLTPAGMARRSGCDALTGRREAKVSPRPAPGLDCWSLIGRIGAGGPFAVGVTKSIEASNGGELLLGVNDNYLRDNAGEWKATVTISSGPLTTTPAAAGKKSSSSSSMLIIVGGLLLAAVLIGVAVFSRVAKARRPVRARPAAAVRKPVPPPRVTVPVEAAKPEPASEQASAVRPVIAIPEAESNAIVVSPEEGDFTDVNIFEVGFPDNASLRVGYNYFPEGTLVRFRIDQRARAASTGDFVTKGGGIQYHFVTVELNGELESNPDGADVIFTWVIGGVPFQYSVRRVLA